MRQLHNEGKEGGERRAAAAREATRKMRTEKVPLLWKSPRGAKAESVK